MKWKNKKDPRNFENNTRHTRRFAWLPTELDDGNIVWLESYWHTQRWNDGTTDGRAGFWNTGKTSVNHPLNTGS